MKLSSRSIKSRNLQRGRFCARCLGLHFVLILVNCAHEVLGSETFDTNFNEFIAAPLLERLHCSNLGAACTRSKSDFYWKIAVFIIC